jgi:transcriptional regulator with XRE-family HTH domain
MRAGREYNRPVPRVGERILTRRRELGLSRRDLAVKGLSVAYIKDAERGKRKPSGKALRKLAPTLGVSVYWLETGRNDSAVQLARLVLAHEGRTLVVGRAAELARAVLADAQAHRY